MSDVYTAALGGKTDTVLQHLDQDPSLLSRPSPSGMFKGYTLLHCAVVKNNADLANALLRLGASPSARDPKGRTAADLALEKGFHALAALLRSTGPTASSASSTQHSHASAQHPHRAAQIQAPASRQFQPASTPAHSVYNGFATAGTYGAGPGSSRAANAGINADRWLHRPPAGAECGGPSEDVSCSDVAFDVPAAAPTQHHTQPTFAFSQPPHAPATAQQPFMQQPITPAAPAPGYTSLPPVQPHIQPFTSAPTQAYTPQPPPVHPHTHYAPQQQQHAPYAPQQFTPSPPPPALQFQPPQASQPSPPHAQQPPPQQQQQPSACAAGAPPPALGISGAALPPGGGAAGASERWASLEAVLLSRVSLAAVAAAVPRPSLGSLLGQDNTRIISLCQEHKVKVDIDHVDANASAVTIMRPGADSGASTVNLMQSNEDTSASAARHAALWSFLEAVPDGLLCGAALPVAEHAAARLSEELLSGVSRLSADARISLHTAPGTGPNSVTPPGPAAPRPPPAATGAGGYLVITGPAASTRLALLLLLRDILHCPSVAALEAFSCTLYPSDFAAASSALAAREPHACMLRTDITAASLPAAQATLPTAHAANAHAAPPLHAASAVYSAPPAHAAHATHAAFPAANAASPFHAAPGHLHAATDASPIPVVFIAPASALPRVSALLAQTFARPRPAPLFRPLCRPGSEAASTKPPFSLGKITPAVHALAVRITNGFPPSDIKPALASLDRPLTSDEVALLGSAPLARLRLLQCARDGRPPPSVDPRDLRWAEEAGAEILAEISRAFVTDAFSVSGAVPAQAHSAHAHLPAQPALSFGYDPGNGAQPERSSAARPGPGADSPAPASHGGAPHVEGEAVFRPVLESQGGRAAEVARPGPAAVGKGAAEVVRGSPAGGAGVGAAASGGATGEKVGGSVGGASVGGASSSDSDSSESESAENKRKKRKREKKERKREKKEKRKRRERAV